ncbi:MAG: alpha/beta hydrolase [Rhodothermales bacterium]|nr:alpha/beta hydrolase [Rhodothermales bacterium]MBO6779944.1 alpha/beta hydrolase [Rhodothermales bacterium]
MRFRQCLLFVSAVLLLAACEAPEATIQVHFRVDMNPATAEGVFDPRTDAVGVRGSVEPLEWSESVLATDLDNDGVYEVRIEVARAGEPLRYKFKIDRPGNSNEGWEEGRDRLISRESGDVEVRRVFNDPPEQLEPTIVGDVRTHEGFSTSFLPEEKQFMVYLPPGYDDGDRRYPVLYMMDGQHLFDQRLSGYEWSADETAERLIARGIIEPVIIVGIFASPANRTREYTPGGRQWEFRRVEGGRGWVGDYTTVMEPDLSLSFREIEGDLKVQLPYEDVWTELEPEGDELFVPREGIYFSPTIVQAGRVSQFSALMTQGGGLADDFGRFLLEDLKPFIDATYRTDPERTSLGGASLGGLLTIYLATRYPGQFDGLLVASPSVWWDERFILDDAANADLSGMRIWIDVGSDEAAGMVSDARELHLVVSERVDDPSDAYFVEALGASHNELAWAARFPDMLRFLYRR